MAKAAGIQVFLRFFLRKLKVKAALEWNCKIIWESRGKINLRPSLVRVDTGRLFLVGEHSVSLHCTFDACSLAQFRRDALFLMIPYLINTIVPTCASRYIMFYTFCLSTWEHNLLVIFKYYNLLSLHFVRQGSFQIFRSAIENMKFEVRANRAYFFAHFMIL